MFEKTRQSRVSPASPYIPPPRRSGRSPALPYPPGGQNEYSRFFHSTQPAFPGRAMPEKTTLFLADETRSEHFCAVQGELGLTCPIEELGLTCPIEGWAKRQHSPPKLLEAGINKTINAEGLSPVLPLTCCFPVNPVNPVRGLLLGRVCR